MNYGYVMLSFFEVFGVEMVSGRFFCVEDDVGVLFVVVVNEVFVWNFFLSGDVFGCMVEFIVFGLDY